MKKYGIVLFFLILASSCSSPSAKNQESTTDTGPQVRVIEESWPDGRLKSTTEAVGKLRHGESREYRKDGTLENLITYKNNRKHGVARNYYPDGRTIKTELYYEEGIKQGESKWYYPDGKLYRLTPYKNGKMDGVRKVYYEKGNLQAEIPYKQGYYGMGLKEYNTGGSERQHNYDILFRETDRVNIDNTFRLTISVSGEIKDVTFYTGNLTEGKYWHEGLAPVPMGDDFGILDYHVSKGTFKMETINVVARIKTSLNNYLILQKEYHLALENRH